MLSPEEIFDKKLQIAQKQKMEIKSCELLDSTYHLEVGLYNYKLLINQDNISCDCIDFLLHNGLCKHLISFLVNELKFSSSFVYTNNIKSHPSYLTRCGIFLKNWQQLPPLESLVKPEPKGPDECVICMVYLNQVSKRIECKRCKMKAHELCVKNFMLKNSLDSPIPCFVCTANIHINEIKHNEVKHNEIKQNVKKNLYPLGKVDNRVVILQTNLDHYFSTTINKKQKN